MAQPRKQTTDHMFWNAIKYLLSGAFLCLIAALFSLGDLRFIAHSEPAQLIVLQVDSRVEHRHSHLNERRQVVMYRPIFALETAARPRPEYSGNTWTSFLLHQKGDIVAGRYDPESGVMQSNQMILWQSMIFIGLMLIGSVIFFEGMLLLYGVPEELLLVRMGGRSRF